MTAAATAPTIAATAAHLGSPPDATASQAAAAAPAKIRMATASDETKIKILARDERLPRNGRNLRQFLHGNLHATELAAGLCTDHDIDVGAVETRA